MRPIVRLSVVALFALVIAGAALAGLAVGRNQVSRPGAGVQAPPPPMASTDQQIASLLARIQRLPDSAEAHTNLGAAYLQKARESGDPSFYGRAEAALSKSLTLDAENADTYVNLGGLALARHRFAEALEHGGRARALNPYKAAALGVIGDAQVELGR